MDILGVSACEPGKEADRDICFVNARIAPCGEGIEPPQSEDYIAAPMVGEVGAGLGYIPQDEVKSWFLAYRHHPAVRFRRNLIAVEIGSTSTSMQPTLNPGDIVLVDRDDRDVQRPGHMMLVTDPDGAGMVKRVAIEDKQDGDYRITFYSDNALQCPPMVYSPSRDYAFRLFAPGIVPWPLSPFPISLPKLTGRHAFFVRLSRHPSPRLRFFAGAEVTLDHVTYS